MFKPALNSDSRIFIAPRRAGCGNRYDYHACMRMDSVEKSFGDTTPIYCPSDRAGQFEEVAQISGGDSRWTSSLVGRLPLDYQSIISQLANARCAFDVQVHFGRCNNPTDFNQFDMAWVFENVAISSYSLGTLGALSPDERATIDESVSFSAEKAYQVFQSNYTNVGANITNGGIVAITNGNVVDCGADCFERCAHFYGLKLPTTPLVSSDIYIIWSTDSGQTWNEILLPCSAVLTGTPYAAYNIQSDGENLYIVLDEVGGNGHLYIVSIAQILAGSITTTFYSPLLNLRNYAVRLIGNQLWFAGTNGRLSFFDKNNYSITTLLNGTVFTNTWYSIGAVGSDNSNIIVGGGSGFFVARRNGGAFTQIPVIVNGVTVTDTIASVHMKTENEWLLGTLDGRLICTVDGGRTFRLIATFAGCVEKIEFSTKNVGYLITKTPGQLWRTIDGGATWLLVPDKFNLITNTAQLLALAVCPDNVNHFIATGRVPVSNPPNPCSLTNNVYTQNDAGLILLGQ